MSESNRVQLRFIEEVTWGTTPDLPAMQALRHTDQSLRHDLQTTQSNEIRSDRSISDLIQTDRPSGGGFNFELSATTFDALMAGAMCADWSTDVLLNGTTRKSFSIEKAYLDITQFMQFTGMVPNTFSLDIAAGSPITGSLEFLGKTPDDALTQASVANSVVDATTTAVMNAIGNVGTIQEGGADLSGVYIRNASFSINNNLRVRNAIGYDSAIDVKLGRQEVTGSIEAYFADETLYDKFAAGTETSLSLPVALDGDSYTFLFPRIKYESASESGGGSDQDVIHTFSFRALYDTTTGGHLEITRVVA
jgi:hypothetical protein